MSSRTKSAHVAKPRSFARSARRAAILVRSALLSVSPPLSQRDV